MANQSVIKNQLKNPFIDLIVKTRNFFKNRARESDFSLFCKSVKGKNDFICAYALLNANTYKEVKLGSKILKKSALKKDENALLLLARNYYYGYGVKKSDKKAFKIWGKGAKLGFAEANYYYGLCFAKGICVSQNIEKAEKFLKVALSNGFSLASVALNDLKFLRA